MERTITSDKKISCQICGKLYCSTKWLEKHEDSHLYGQFNHKVKVAAEQGGLGKKQRKCKFCSYESDRKSSIDK